MSDLYTPTVWVDDKTVATATIMNNMEKGIINAINISTQVREELDSIAIQGGVKGEKGDKGDKGDPGERGLKGDKGDPGERGPQGPQGLQGPQGVQGPKGLRGEKGDKGERGLKGDPGLKGDKGDKGDPGERGLQGLKGDKGDKGEPGERGLKGDKGDKGDPGIFDSTTVFSNLNTTSKTVIGAINELYDMILNGSVKPPGNEEGTPSPIPPGNNNTGGGSNGNGITTSQNNYTITVGTGNLEIPITINKVLPSYPVWEVRQNGSYFLYCYKSGNNINVDTSSLGTGIYDNLTIVAKENNSGSYVDVATSNTFSITVGNSSSSGGSTTPISINHINNINVSPNTSFEITYSTNIDATKHEISYDEGNSFVPIYPSSSGTTYKFMHEGVSSQWSEHKRIIRVTDSNNNTATSNKFTIYVNSSGSGGSSGNVNTNSLVLNMQHSSSHNCIPNCPESIEWKHKPRMGHGIAIPNSYQDGQPWKAFGQWLTVYKENGKQLVENVGVELTDFKMWRYNVNTNQWVLINDTFDYGSFYLEDFWDDGNAPLNSNKILSPDKKTYKCLMNSATNGRCFHPFSAQKNWSDFGFSGSPSYVVSQVKFRLIKWDENGVDNRAKANLCVNAGGDYWIYKGASFDSQWRHNGDFAIGNFIKATNDWQYAYATSCPQSWDKGFPVDTI